MKIIFLDIDGVLNSGDYMRALHVITHNAKKEGSSTRDEFGQLFDPRCITYLDYIIRMTGAKIVISSTWRYFGLSKLKDMWAKRNLPGEVIDITCKRTEVDPELEERHYQPNTDRGYEIQQWLEDHTGIESYVILDDDCDMLSSQSFVKCTNEFGITYDVAKLVINKLNTIQDASTE